MERSKEKSYPVNDKDYKLCEEIGEGVSATVYRAICIPLNEEVAIKVLDLEKCNNDLDGIRREVQTMSLINHPNLLRAHCSFTSGHSLWVVTPYMAAGSCLHIMKSSYPEGFEEAVIATLLREVLKALIYLHAQGHIHRDVKAGNILIDSNGAVKLADFGVSACMFHAGDRHHSRNTFVGTPCWMAPEVMQQLHGYDFKADIWSFGITALELAHGHAPFSKYPPMKVLLMTLQNAPPGLDYERDKRFSKSFKEMVATCLVKDPKKRPTSEKLLKHSFFKHGRSSDYLGRTILGGLPPLGDRFRIVKENESDLLAQNKELHENKEQLSQQEYIRGISAWNFNLEDLKNEAAHIQDCDGNSNEEDHDESVNQMNTSSNIGFQTERPSPDRTTCSDSSPSHEEGFSDLNDLESSLASFPLKPLQALKGCFDIRDDDTNAGSPQSKEILHLDHQQLLPQSSLRSTDSEIQKHDRENMGHGSSLPHHVFPEHKKFYSGSLVLDSAHKKFGAEGSRDILQPKFQSARNYSGPLLHSRKTDTNNLSYVNDAQGGAVVQRKGRFKVTSADSTPKDPTNCISSPVPGGSTTPTIPNHSVTSVLPSLQFILQQNIMQKEEIVKLIKHMEQTSGKHPDSAEASTNDLMQTSPASAREKELQYQVSHLQQSVGSLVEELQRQKLKNAQLEMQVNAIVNGGKEKDNADITYK